MFVKEKEEREFCIPGNINKKQDMIITKEKWKSKEIKNVSEAKRRNDMIKRYIFDIKIGLFTRILIIDYLIFQFLIYNILSSNMFIMNKSYFSKIKLKIKGNAQGKYYNPNFNPQPDEIVEGEAQQMDGDYSEIEVELIWNQSPTNCSRMFYGCSNISEIDFSDFDSSNVENMNYMFNGCSSLTSINFNNFDTSKVTDMQNLFVIVNH